MADQWASKEELAGLREQAKGNLGTELVTKALELKRISRELTYRRRREVRKLEDLFNYEIKRLKKDIDSSLVAAKVLLTKSRYLKVLEEMREIENQALAVMAEEDAEMIEEQPTPAEDILSQDTEARKDLFLDKVEDFMNKQDPLAEEPPKKDEQSLNTTDNYDNQTEENKEEETQGG